MIAKANEPLPQPEIWQAWRRAKHTHDAWHKVPGIDPGAKSDIFAAISREFWKAYETEYEYEILPVGRVPSERFGSGKGQGPLSHTYKTKVMRPQ